jgi:Ca2+-binding RTX toxin-like protein
MRFSRLAAAGAAVPVLVLGMMSPAFADDIHNDLDGSIDAAAETMALNEFGPDGTTNLLVQPVNGDGKNGCNLTAGTTLTLSVSSSDSGVATVSPTSVTFASCGDVKALTVTPVAQGSTSVTVAQTSNNTGGTFNLAPAAFDVTVGAPLNTAPTVTVSGVTDGSSYDFGSVPVAMCDVVDAEDGDSSFAATLSAITGPDAANGIGSQTADCEYTDAGLLSDTDSATYDIVDVTAPSVSYTFDPAAPDGDNGWYVSDVDVDWTVDEADSTSTLLTTDCDDFTVNTDQAATDYTCMTSSDGGTTDVTTDPIKRDATAPAADFVDGPDADATYFFGLETVPAAPTCDANDNLSGVAAPGCTVGGWSDQIGSHTLTADVSDEAGNSTHIERDYEVVACTLETSVIGSVCAPKCDGIDATIKGTGGTVLGTAGDDVIVGTVGIDDIQGLGGNDLICAFAGADTIDGGEGNDLIFGGENADNITADDGDDKVVAGRGRDIVDAGIGTDELRGGLGNDQLTSGGDANGDKLVGEGGTDTLTGGPGDDQLSGGPGADTLIGGDGNDQLLGGGDDDDVQGGAGDDILKGATGNDTMDGGEGDDVLWGESGDDTMSGGDGADKVRGGVGADILNGGLGADLINGGEDNDTLNGDEGNDILKGNDGDDALLGGDDDDRLEGGPGVDTLDGGLGINILLP